VRSFAIDAVERRSFISDESATKLLVDAADSAFHVELGAQPLLERAIAVAQTGYISRLQMLTDTPLELEREEFDT
jgi:hypothetical protein